MASSIHTIYRPLARSKRDYMSVLRGSRNKKLPSVSDVENEQLPAEEPVMSEDEIEEDFEPMRPDTSDPKVDNSGLQLSLPPPPTATLDSPQDTASVKTHPTRSGSMATVKLQRRARLAEKLREIFDLTGIEEVVAGA